MKTNPAAIESAKALEVPCRCGAAIGQPCMTKRGETTTFHAVRGIEAKQHREATREPETLTKLKAAVSDFSLGKEEFRVILAEAAAEDEKWQEALAKFDSESDRVAQIHGQKMVESLSQAWFPQDMGREGNQMSLSDARKAFGLDQGPKDSLRTNIELGERRLLRIDQETEALQQEREVVIDYLVEDRLAYGELLAVEAEPHEGHYHFADGSCDMEPSYRDGGPA